MAEKKENFECFGNKNYFVICCLVILSHLFRSPKHVAEETEPLLNSQCVRLIGKLSTMVETGALYEFQN